MLIYWLAYANFDKLRDILQGNLLQLQVYSLYLKVSIAFTFYYKQEVKHLYQDAECGSSVELNFQHDQVEIVYPRTKGWNVIEKQLIVSDCVAKMK